MRYPSMLKIGPHQYQLRIINYFNVIANNTLGTFGILNEVQFKFLVIVDGKIKFIFYPGKKSKTIALGERRNFSQNILIHRAS
jgi:hypothetical protein